MAREQRIWRKRLVFQIASLILVNSMIFGAISFGESPLLRDIYLPNATTKFFANAPTYSVVYKVQDTLAAEFNKLYSDLVLPLFIFVVLVLLLGRVWCAWLCPLGLPQDLLSLLRKKLGISYYRIPRAAGQVLHASKYLALFLIIFYTLSLGIPGFGLYEFRTALAIPYEQLDPNRALYVYPQIALGLLPPSTVVPWLSILTTLFFLTVSFKIRRFWCHICPAGAMQGLLHRQALFQLKKDSSKCTSCGVCARVCPMGIQEVYSERAREVVTHRNCTHCYKCVECCPEDDCLQATFLGRTFLRSKSMEHFDV
ncbi:MAG: 4Fe-4S binding protein [Thermoplasmata archaeon]